MFEIRGYFVCCDMIIQFFEVIFAGGGEFFTSPQSIIVKVILCIIALPLAIALFPLAFLIDLIILPLYFIKYK